MAVFELGASFSHQADLLTFCGSLLGQIGKKCTLRGAGVTPKGTPGGPRGKLISPRGPRGNKKKLGRDFF